LDFLGNTNISEKSESSHNLVKNQSLCVFGSFWKYGIENIGLALICLACRSQTLSLKALLVCQIEKPFLQLA
jgi:hypothetical protein